MASAAPRSGRTNIRQSCMQHVAFRIIELGERCPHSRDISSRTVHRDDRSRRQFNVFVLWRDYEDDSRVDVAFVPTSRRGEHNPETMNRPVFEVSC